MRDLKGDSDIDEVTYDELLGMGANDAGAVGLRYMDLLHEMRGFCQGQLNGKMKPKIHAAQKVINALIAKALSSPSSGDSALLEVRFREITANLDATKEELARYKTENGALRSENANLCREIEAVKTEMKKIEEVRLENEDLRRQMREVRKDLQNLKRTDPRKEVDPIGGGKKDGRFKPQVRPTSAGRDSPVAGPSGMSAPKSSTGVIRIVSAAETKKGTGKRPLEVSKDPRDTGRGGVSSEDACPAMD